MASTQTPTRLLTGLLASGSLVVALTTFPAGSVPLPKPRPQSTPAKAGVTPSAPAAAPQAAAPSELPAAADIAALKEAITAARRGKTTQAADLQKTIRDRVARKLVEWQILRSDDSQNIDVSRYMAFITENPSWPSTALMRRRAEATLWADRLDPAFVRAFFGKERPVTTKGKFALARKTWRGRPGATTASRASSKTRRSTSSRT